ncbi:hypothetical protein CC1G_12869 [Coprinopsis cinerea okayama7|uniref:DNA 3'-5' helicase n=1 Tax=Coprinopsis cinerea (strain Okayama-7 / 130 / ATCC MYA-4618 / FGSC 9003) TaxID=240176 RepID=A8P8F3_COPC7|nr:hypothetical protein CC1G_12869 [Coprinopsis cinerea okayama7\|eukprot:XP_001839558.2 hypothetical protein CC1G_12869 [Coprinopsis cinerea okayama7\
MYSEGEAPRRHDAARLDILPPNWTRLFDSSSIFGPRNMGQSPTKTIPTVEQIRKRVQDLWNIRPCLWQIEVVQAILERDGDIVSVAGTGMGKTLTFWMPILFSAPGSVQIIVTPLNLLGQQQVATAEKLGLKAVFVCGDSAPTINWHDVATGVYQVLVINPELLMRPGGGFEKIARLPSFRQRIISLIFDEGHCISTWSSFRHEYKHIGNLSYILPADIPRVITTATLPDTTLDDIKKTLHLGSRRLKLFHFSIDRPNINITIKKIQSDLNTFEDLRFVLNGYVPGKSAPKATFAVFFDNIPESIAARDALLKHLSPEDFDKILWFNSEMSGTFKTEHVEALRTGKLWGILTTESFGVGLDLPNIDLVGQWRATCSITALWQRFGRAGRDRSKEATAVFLVEKEYFDDEKKRKEAKRLARLQKKNKKARNNPATIPGSVTFIQEGQSNSSSSSESDDELPQITTPAPSTSAQPGRKRKKPERVIEPEMDELINAKQRKYPCVRIPILKAFKDNRAGGSRNSGFMEKILRLAVALPELR